MTARRRSTHDIFIEGWGRLGPSWGISKMMAEIYALLYVSPSPLTLEAMSGQLATSRSNISTNVRGLLDLGVVHKVIVRGERKDYFDLFALTERGYSLERIVMLFEKKFGFDAASSLVRAAAYFDDAEDTPDPVALWPDLSWQRVQDGLRDAVRQFAGSA